jgi:hypothetical protein
MHDEEHRRDDQPEAHKVIPAKLLFQVQHRDNSEYRQGNHFLYQLELRRAETSMPHTVSGATSTHQESPNACILYRPPTAGSASLLAQGRGGF